MILVLMTFLAASSLQKSMIQGSMLDFIHIEVWTCCAERSCRENLAEIHLAEVFQETRRVFQCCKHYVIGSVIHACKSKLNFLQESAEGVHLY